MSRKWPYLWYNPETGEPYQIHAKPRPLPEIPTSNKTQRLREEFIAKNLNPGDVEFVFSNRKMKKNSNSNLIAVSTKSQLLRQQASAIQIRERELLSQPIKSKQINRAVLSPHFIPIIRPTTTKTQQLRDNLLKIKKESSSEITIKDNNEKEISLDRRIIRANIKKVSSDSNMKQQLIDNKNKQESRTKNNLTVRSKSQTKQNRNKKDTSVKKSASSSTVKTFKDTNKSSSGRKKRQGKSKSSNSVTLTENAISRNRMNQLKDKLYRSSLVDVNKTDTKSCLAFECAALLSRSSNPNKVYYTPDANNSKINLNKNNLVSNSSDYLKDFNYYMTTTYRPAMAGNI